MSAALLLDASNFKVLISYSEVSTHLLKSLISNGVDSKLLLALSKAKPELTPGRVTRALAEKLRHGRAAVAGGQRRLVAVIGGSGLGSHCCD